MTSNIPAVESLMTACPVSVEIDETVRVAVDLMTDHEVRHLPVTQERQLVGLVSDRDIAFTQNGAASGIMDRIRIRDVCSLDIYAVSPQEPIDLVLEEMVERRIGSVVVSRDDKVLGIFTATDACRCFARFLRAAVVGKTVGRGAHS